MRIETDRLAGSHHTSTAQATEQLGARLAQQLRPGDVVLLTGELGAGKTTLVRGACRELGVTDPVTSPTFTIGNRYSGNVPIAHLDLYRIESLDREDPTLLDDYIDCQTITFVEWPAVAVRRGVLKVRATITMAHGGTYEQQQRQIRIEL